MKKNVSIFIIIYIVNNYIYEMKLDTKNVK